MKFSAQEYMRKCSEFELYLECQAVGGRLYQEAKKARQAKQVMATPLNPENQNLLMEQKKWAASFLREYSELEQHLARLRKEAVKFDVKTPWDFDIWLGFWQQFTSQMSMENLILVTQRIAAKQDISEFLPSMTWWEWDNAKIRRKRMDIKIIRK